MATVQIRDDAIWLKHIEGNPTLRARLEKLRPGEIVALEVDGIVGQWERMRDGRDGRPTHGIKPISAMRIVWSRLRQQTGRVVQLREVGRDDAYLAALTPLLDEWNSAEDEAAYGDL